MKKLPKISKISKEVILNSGQALLVVLLSMSVVLAVLLSSVSKSVTDITITDYEENSLRAFSAAEAGIEQALLDAVPGSVVTDRLDVTDPADPHYDAKVAAPDAGDVIEFPDKLKSGQVATFWFVSHDNNGNLTCAGKKTCIAATHLEFCWTGNPALEIAIYYDNTGASYGSPNNYSNLKVKRFNFDPKGSYVGRNFIEPSSGCSFGSHYSYTTRDHLKGMKSKMDPCVNSGPPSCLIAAKVRVLDNPTVGQSVAIKARSGASTNLPSQGIQISSTGTSGDSTRNVTVLQGYPDPPDVFEGVLYSGKDISQ